MHLIFDLDGTLVDSRPGILHSLGRAVREVYPQIDPEGLDLRIGPPVRAILARALPSASPTDLNQLEAAFRRVYDREGWRLAPLYAQVQETLKRFKAAGMSLYVVTYKPAQPTGLILRNCGIAGLFADVLSPDSCQPAWTTKAEGLCCLLEKHAVPPTEAIYLGDGSEDLAAAHASGLAFIGLKYGYGTFPGQAEDYLLVDSFGELEARLLSRMDRLPDE